MKKFGKFLSVLLAAVMAVSSLCVAASAATATDSELAKLEKGTKVKSGATFTRKSSSSKSKTYKIEVSKKGYLTIDFESTAPTVFLRVSDAEGRRVSGTPTIFGGRADLAAKSTEITITKDGRKDLTSGKVSYIVDKGTHYIEVYGNSKKTKESGQTVMKFTYPATSSNTSKTSGDATIDSATGKITALTITLKKGSSLQLGTTTSGKGSVSWSTSKRSVASVSSKGKVTAKAKGSAVITAKLGTTSYAVTIKVS